MSVELLLLSNVCWVSAVESRMLCLDCYITPVVLRLLCQDCYITPVVLRLLCLDCYITPVVLRLLCQAVSSRREISFELITFSVASDTHDESSDNDDYGDDDDDCQLVHPRCSYRKWFLNLWLSGMIADYLLILHHHISLTLLAVWGLGKLYMSIFGCITLCVWLGKTYINILTIMNPFFSRNNYIAQINLILLCKEMLVIILYRIGLV